MVSFSCDHCAEILKKNQVDVHARKCRNCASVSCVDCSDSFYGDDYRSHNSCVSEAERYEKTVYRGPKKHDALNRKLTPQEQWMEIIRTSLNRNPTPNIESYINQLSIMENTPRKEGAFINFAMNSLKLRGDTGRNIASSIWNHLSTVRQDEMKKNKKEEDLPLSTTSTNVETTTIESKVAEEKELTVKSIEKIMKKILKKQSSHRLTFKLLRRKIKSKLRRKEIKYDKDKVKVSISQSSLVRRDGDDLILI